MFLVPLYLCWGSFLNVVAYRTIRGESIVLPPSQCPHCFHRLAWFDLIPVVSWFYLRGRCRYCCNRISALYPFIELLTALAFLGLHSLVPSVYFFSYALFFSALIVTIRTDLEYMLISQYATLGMIPLAFLLSFLGYLPITLPQSLFGAIGAYFLLYAVAKLFKQATGKAGMGEGDIELLAMIGAFLGFMPSWLVLFAASILGSCIGLACILWQRKTISTRIPFGPFLALGAILVVLGHKFLQSFLCIWFFCS